MSHIRDLVNSIRNNPYRHIYIILFISCTVWMCVLDTVQQEKLCSLHEAYCQMDEGDFEEAKAGFEHYYNGRTQLFWDITLFVGLGSMILIIVPINSLMTVCIRNAIWISLGRRMKEIMGVILSMIRKRYMDIRDLILLWLLKCVIITKRLDSALRW